MSDEKSPHYPIVVDPTCPLGAIYFLPHGSTSKDLSTGKTLELAPGYYVNPRSVGMIKNVDFSKMEQES